MKVDHIAIWTNDLEKEKEFFLKYFDCTVNDKYENPGKHFSSYFVSFSEGCRIELMFRNGTQGKAEISTSGLAHFAINIGPKENVDFLTKKLENDGYIIESYPRTTGDGYYESVILDPENNRIELISGC